MENASIKQRLINCSIDEDDCEQLQLRRKYRIEQQRQNKLNSNTKLPKLLSRASGKALSDLSSSCAAKIIATDPPKTPPLPVQYSSKKTAAIKLMNGSSGLNAKTAKTVKYSNSSASTNKATTISSNSIGGNHNNNASSGGVVGGGVIGASTGNSQRVTSSRRPHIQITPITESPKTFQLLTLIIHKDENGYGMKVSGDNPVFVESVKPGGAAQNAGLIAGDMILKVNGQEVRSETHPTVVSLIKSHVVVELAVKRSQKMQRPSSVGIGPLTPVLSGRDRTASITGPQPVDNAKRREMESYKIQTLQMMLEQEKLNMERLKGDPNNSSYKTSEANIRKLKEQLRQIGAEDSPTIKCQSPLSSSLSKTSALSPTQIIQQQHHHTHNLNYHATTPQPQQSSPAFLSLLPRSLSSLSLGTRKKADKEITTSPLSNTTDFVSTPTHAASPLSSHCMSQSLHQQKTSQQCGLYHHHQQKHNDKHKFSGSKSNKFSGSQKNLKEDTPPPLPQRNPPRNLILETSKSASSNISSSSSDWRRNVPISDLDNSMSMTVAAQPATSPHCASPTLSTQTTAPSNMKSSSGNIISSGNKKRPKTKTKALSDPKMSTQMFLQMEKTQGSLDGNEDDNCIPPPLPPRQPGMMEEAHCLLGSNKQLSSVSGSFSNLSSGNGSGRPPPNSIETIMNYPLVSTCTAVRDNMSAAFPLSHRPNIVQQLQQHQQQQQQQQMHVHHHQSNVGNSGCVAPPSLSSGAAQHFQSNSTALGQAHFNKHRRVVSSPDNMHPRNDRQNKTTSGSWELHEKDNEATPPGTPPPPYPSSHSMLQSQNFHGVFIEDVVPDNPFSDNHHFAPIGSSGSSNQHSIKNIPTQKEIISMEDEDTSDQEGIVDENGPFNYLQRLLEPENVAHLAVFLNYVLSNSDPAPLLFYLITGLYKEGTVKDMRKWAYEIHSTFLVPCAPLVWFRSDESLAREVDNILQNEFDKVEILRNVFLKSRKKAKGTICEQLREFQQKRTAGLGTIYGPPDSQLADAKGDKTKEQRIFEETLIPKLQFWLDEHEKDAPVEDPKKLALCSALSTVLHRIFITRSNPNSIIDRVHHFVSREKSFKSRIMGKNRKMTVRGHPLVLQQYYEVTHCNHCQNIIWGVSPQGYHCTDCKLNIHRPCSKVLDESCPGPVPQKRKDQHTDNKISKFMEKIRPTTHFMQMEKRARQDEETVIDDSLNTERLHSTSIVRQPSDRRPDITNVSYRSNGNSSQNSTEVQGSQFLDAESNADAHALDADKNTKKDRSQQQKSTSVSVNRSESYKDRLSQKRSRNNRRKTSDPSLSSRPNDDQTDLGMSNSNYTASSNSSLSSGGGSDSPSTSMEQVGGLGVTSNNSATHNTTVFGHNHNAISGSGSGVGSANNNSTWSGNSTTTVGYSRQWQFESDDDDDVLHEADWSSNVAAEMLATLTDAEKKRQEIINEIYQTERSHVRTLKLLERIFMCPLQESGVLSYDHLMLLFPPALLSLKDLHSSFEQKLKMRRIDHNHIVSHVGDLLAGMFDGQSGEELREHAAEFCARQQMALEALKEKRRKDEQLHKMLTKAESHKSCRRLQLKDLLPTVLQRLTKYPLLFENLIKITIRVMPEDQMEADRIQRALDSSKKILVDVNQAVKTAEDAYKLQTIQRKLDKSTFDKDEFKNLDLTQFKLIHDGNLTLKKNPGIQLHGLLFENMIVLLTKQDDKYSLKSLSATRSSEVNKFISPITYIDQETLVRQEAADKNSFFLIMTKTSQMLELRAPSSSECKTWFKHISDAAEQYKPRSKSNHEITDDPAIATLPHSSTKDILEVTPERSVTVSMTTPVISSIANNKYRQHQEDDIQDNAKDSVARNHHNLLANNNDAYLGNTGGNMNRTMSTRSCEESQNSSSGLASENLDDDSKTNIGSNSTVNLRHTQSARNTSGNENETNPNAFHRDSSCIIYSNNSNDTRTLMQNNALVEPSAIQISISPAHTAEPVLTPSERLKRLDMSIRNGLIEKQKIICDIFHLPIENFNEIVDIAAQPEAPKDSADIALAAYAQVQSLTELLNNYLGVTSTEQQISAVSTLICDRCNQQQEQDRLVRSTTPSILMPTAVPESCTSVDNNSKSDRSPTPPPLPPPLNSNNNKNHQKSIQVPPKTPLLDDQVIHEDDDGYCEIDELRLPSLSMPSTKISSPTVSSPSQYQSPSTSLTAPSLPAPAATGALKAPASTSAQQQTIPATSELSKRQSTLSADSIPEESEQDITQSDGGTIDSTLQSKDEINTQSDASDKTQNEPHSFDSQNQNEQSVIKTKEKLPAEHIEVNDTYDSTLKMESNMLTDNKKIEYQSPGSILCGPNRFLHASSLEPSVPCHAINSIVAALNSQISLLLPKINERDLERERLRRENQNLRELLNAMHERHRVESKLETQPNITSSADADDTNHEVSPGSK